eukprot:TRINITY_DN2828_c0_g1_i4.p1 TRINITY_DN2828_c0_g1~~TRINITY_DN2828_c0_g1_i4.p1  ORF type:complete len:215 (+),score=43.13 TRINITY_DN2828_c0_g1_i4:84-728(+)
MECICVRSLNLGNVEDITVFEAPNVNVTQDLVNPHHVAFIPTNEPQCNGDDDNNQGNTNHSNNGNGNNPVLPPRSSDSMDIPTLDPRERERKRQHQEELERQNRRRNGDGDLTRRNVNQSRRSNSNQINTISSNQQSPATSLSSSPSSHLPDRITSPSPRTSTQHTLSTSNQSHVNNRQHNNHPTSMLGPINLFIICILLVLSTLAVRKFDSYI